MNDETKELQSYSPHGLISQALAQNVPIGTLERLMDLQERWQAAQAKSEFLEAMTNFQSKVPEIIKTKQGHNNKFAPLPKITKTIQPILRECGLSYRWSFEDVGELIKCSCIVSHIAGHSETDSMTAPKDNSGNKSDIHAIGSTRTYLQRYTLIGALGLSTADVDNDGKASSTKETIPEPQEKIDWGKLIMTCESVKELNAVWKRMSEKEQSEHKGTFTKIKTNIQSASKKENK